MDRLHRTRHAATGLCRVHLQQMVPHLSTGCDRTQRLRQLTLTVGWVVVAAVEHVRAGCRELCRHETTRHSMPMLCTTHPLAADWHEGKCSSVPRKSMIATSYVLLAVVTVTATCTACEIRGREAAVVFMYATGGI